MPPAFLSLVILETGSCFLPWLARTLILLFYTSYSTWDDRHSPLCPVFFPEMWSLEHFCLGWPETVILLILAFCIAGMTGVSHYNLLLVETGVSLFPLAGLKL
jgi:hypothetical protein